MEASGHSQTFKPTSKALFVCFVMFVAGMVCFGYTLSKNPAEAWSHWLIGAFYTTMMALFGIFFCAMNYASGAGWNVVIRRVNEAMASNLIIGFLAMVILVIGLLTSHDKGMERIYEWLHLHHDHGAGSLEHAGGEMAAAAHSGQSALDKAHHELLEHKSPWLNQNFWIIRMVAYFAIWGFFAWKIISNSRKQDIDGDVKRTRANVRWSCLFIVFFAATVCLASFDWIMSLEPTWFSTIFGVYHFAGLFAGGVSTTIVLLFILRRMGYLKEVNANHFHNLGIWLIVTTIFWGYIWFSQMMLIWYSNIPEETQFYVFRMTNPEWDKWFYINLGWNFIVPFLLLLQQPIKRNEKALFFIAIWVLIGRWIDLYWSVGPIPFLDHATHVYGFSKDTVWLSVGTVVGFAGLFGFVFFKALAKAPLQATKDPYYEESLHHHSA
ncbi:MAG: hypothetical protein HUU29_03705 [Planctomycetaceae bacterium]|nr:hypothetical protein [Planctomycetaceae bacterium]